MTENHRVEHNGSESKKPTFKDVVSAAIKDQNRQNATTSSGSRGERTPLLPSPSQSSNTRPTIHSNPSSRLTTGPISFPRSGDPANATSKTGKDRKERPRPDRLSSFPPSRDPYPTSNPVPSPSSFSSSGLSSISSGSSASDDGWLASPTSPTSNTSPNADGDGPGVGESHRTHHHHHNKLHKPQKHGHHHGLHKHHKHHHHHGYQQNGYFQGRENGATGDLDPEAQQSLHRRTGRQSMPSTSLRHDGLPKVSRECLWSEIKCYGRYMIPPLLIFGVLAIGASLIAVSIRKGWINSHN